MGDTVTDPLGARTVVEFDRRGQVVGGGDPVNDPPHSVIAPVCAGLECVLDGSASADADGSIGRSTATAHLPFTVADPNWGTLRPGALVWGVTSITVTSPHDVAHQLQVREQDGTWVDLGAPVQRTDGRVAFIWDTTAELPAAAGPPVGHHELRVLGAADDTILLEPLLVDVANGANPTAAVYEDYVRGGLAIDEAVLEAARTWAGRPSAYEGLEPLADDTLPTWQLLAHWDDLQAETRELVEDILVPDLSPATEFNRAQGCHGTDAPVVYNQLGSEGFVTECLRVVAPDGNHQYEVTYHPVPVTSAYVDRVEEGIRSAVDVYNQMGFTTPTGPIRVQVGVGGRAHALPIVDTIYLSNSDEVATIRHEVFHHYQYQYVNPVTAIAHIDALLWWLESSAEWATAQVNHDPAHREIGGAGYARNLPAFLDEPGRPITRFHPFDNDQYGSFILPEYLSGRVDVDVVRRIWEELAVGYPTYPSTAIANVLADEGLEWADEIANFRLWSYILYPGLRLPENPFNPPPNPGPMPISIDANPDSSSALAERSWRHFLQGGAGPLSTSGSTVHTARPARTTATLAGGTTRTDPSGAAYLEIVPADFLTGSDQALRFAIDPGTHETTTAYLVGFDGPDRDYPNICLQPTPLLFDDSGIITTRAETSFTQMETSYPEGVAYLDINDCGMYTVVVVDRRIPDGGLYNLADSRDHATASWTLEVVERDWANTDLSIESFDHPSFSAVYAHTEPPEAPYAPWQYDLEYVVTWEAGFEWNGEIETEWADTYTTDSAVHFMSAYRSQTGDCYDARHDRARFELFIDGQSAGTTAWTPWHRWIPAMNGLSPPC